MIKSYLNEFQKGIYSHTKTCVCIHIARISLGEHDFHIMIRISVQFITKSPTDNKSALFY